MAYFDPNGREVTAADALSNGKLRSGYRQTINPGDYLSFDVNLVDAKPKGGETSIDAELRSLIATLAKNKGVTPADYLANTPMTEIQKLAFSAAETVMERLSGNGIASSLADQRTRGMAHSKMMAAARYQGYPMIEAADGDNPGQPSMGPMSPRDFSEFVRKARYA